MERIRAVSGKRTARVGDLLREILVELIRSEMRDPRVQSASVTHVDVTADLRQARVYVSTLGAGAERAACVAALNRAAGRLRRLLAPQVRLRTIPELHFVEDRAVERGMRIEDLLRQIREERQGRSGVESQDNDAPAHER